ncbi:MAG: TIGR03619 family F420-dependent LLM class oxidoreductase [Candidatus Binatia bacterium]
MNSATASAVRAPNGMQFWQALTFTEIEQLLPVVRICEEVGFDGVIIGDHLLHFEQVRSGYPYAENGQPPYAPETPWPEPWSTIAAMAGVTTTLRFATDVYILPLRNPIDVAKAVATVAALFEGRVILGAGLGWMKEEFELQGVDFRTRGKRCDECIEVLRKLWSGGMVEHHGQFFDLPRVQLRPVPKTRIPIYLGGMSPAALRRAARLGDGWLCAGITSDLLLKNLKVLEALRAEAGRRSEPFEVIAPLTDPPAVDTLKRIEAAGTTGILNFPFTFTVASTSTVEQKRAYLERYGNEVIARMRSRR